jgi:ERCC4-type nuclease
MSQSKITEARQVEILEEIAESGPDTAKIQAIKLLREIQGVSKPVTSDFAGLYEVKGASG